MSLEEWSDLHGEDYQKQKLFSALDWGRGDRTCIRITCDYCEQQFEIKEDELDDWTVIDPESGDKAVMCGECESRRTKRAPDVLARCQKCNALIETTVHCDNCGTFEPTRR